MMYSVLLLLSIITLRASDGTLNSVDKEQYVFDAIIHGQSDVVKKYITETKKIPYGALTCAVINKKEDLVTHLVECGADINEEVDIELATGGPCQLQKMGCECTKPEYTGVHKFPCRLSLYRPLHVACKMGDASLFALLKWYASPIMTTISNSQMLLHWALDGHNEEIVLDLIDESGSAINKQNVYGDTPLHAAIPCHSCTVVQSLLTHGADAKIRNDKGRSPLHIAVKKGLIEKVKMLIPCSDLNAQDYNEFTPLLEALSCNCQYYADPIYCKIALLLISHSGDLGVKPLVGAIESGQTEIVAYLLAKGVDPLSLDPDWRTTVFDADFRSNPKIEALLFNAIFPEIS